MNKKHLGLLLFLIFFALVIFEITSDKAVSFDEYVSLANQMGMKGDHLSASKTFKKAIDVNPRYIPAYLGLGIAYGNLGRNEEAIEVFKEGIKIDQIHHFAPQMQMGIASIAYDKMHNEEMALKYVKRALQLYTDQGNYAGVASAAQKLKQIKQTLEY